MKSINVLTGIVGTTLMMSQTILAEECQFTLKSGEVFENQNVILTDDRSGVCATGVENVTIRNVNFISAGGAPAIHIVDSSGVTVENSTAQISGFGARIFWFDNVKDSVVSSNRMLSNGESHLLRLDNSDSMVVKDNTFTTVNSGSDNVRVYNSNNLTFDGNTFNTTRGYGFLLGNHGETNTIEGLVFTNNVFNGNAVFWAVNDTTVGFVTEKSLNNKNNTSLGSDAEIYGNQGTATYNGSIQFN